jgi:hypothetical protein
MATVHFFYPPFTSRFRAFVSIATSFVWQTHEIHEISGGERKKNTMSNDTILQILLVIAVILVFVLALCGRSIRLKWNGFVLEIMNKIKNIKHREENYD